MKKHLIVIGMTLMLLVVGLSGCNEVNNDAEDDREYSDSSFVGTWIYPNTYDNSYNLEFFNSDGSYNNEFFESKSDFFEGSWSKYKGNKLYINYTVESNSVSNEYSMLYDYYFTDDYNTLNYGTKDLDSGGNFSMRLYKLDGTYQFIFLFQSNLSTIQKGEDINLSWIVIGGSDIYIDEGIGKVDNIGYKIISLDETTTFTLTVNSDGLHDFIPKTSEFTVIVEEETDEDVEEEKDYPIAVFDTSFGVFKVELNIDKMPITCNNFIKLAKDEFYDGIVFHRVIDDFMIQGGGYYANGTQKISPYGTINLEVTEDLKHIDGAISMARTNDPNSATSQFFICDGEPSFLDGNYAVFGVVIEGIEIVRTIASVETTTKNGMQDWPINDVIIDSITIENE